MANEKRLIDPELLKARFYAISDMYNTEHIFIDRIIDEIDDTDDVDAVEVVRCGVCIHRVKGTYAKCHGRMPDEFCSDGERRFHV